MEAICFNFFFLKVPSTTARLRCTTVRWAFLEVGQREIIQIKTVQYYRYGNLPLEISRVASFLDRTRTTMYIGFFFLQNFTHISTCYCNSLLRVTMPFANRHTRRFSIRVQTGKVAATFCFVRDNMKKK